MSRTCGASLGAALWRSRSGRVLANCVVIADTSAISHRIDEPDGSTMPKSDLDTIDGKILAALQADARLSNLELADRVGLSPSPCLRRVRRLEKDGYIDGYRAM